MPYPGRVSAALSVILVLAACTNGRNQPNCRGTNLECSASEAGAANAVARADAGDAAGSSGEHANQLSNGSVNDAAPHRSEDAHNDGLPVHDASAPPPALDSSESTPRGATGTDTSAHHNPTSARQDASSAPTNGVRDVDSGFTPGTQTQEPETSSPSADPTSSEDPSDTDTSTTTSFSDDTPTRVLETDSGLDSEPEPDSSAEHQHSCSDALLNGDESDKDCGGSCSPCARGLRCRTANDCSPDNTDACIDDRCVAGPTSHFRLSHNGTQAPITVSAISEATSGDAELHSVEYDFGEGEGFTSTAEHIYATPGTYTVRQRVIDAHGLSAQTSRQLVIQATAMPVYLSTSDRVPSTGVDIGADKLTLELSTGETAGIRSERPILPGSGFYYFEAQRLAAPLFLSYVGVVTSAFALDSEPGTDAFSVGVDIGGSIQFDGSTLSGFAQDASHYGFAIDYRGATPIVHVIVDPPNIVSVTLSEVSEALYIYLGGRRITVGPQLHVNTGNDVTNFPFFHDPRTLLANQGIASDDLVLGFGQSISAPVDTPPNLSVQAPSSVALGEELELTAIATDAEDGNLSDVVQWADAADTYSERTRCTGSECTFLPQEIGLHPIDVAVTDSHGMTTRRLIDVWVTGELVHAEPVRLIPDARSGRDIELREDGLAARFVAHGKYGLRANQGLFDGFQYFEMRRLAGINNQGGGVVTLDGDLDPYRPSNVPPSCSINHSASIWRNLISVADYDTHATQYYGVAVDYRERHPRVFFITQSATLGAAAVAHTMVLDDVTVPLYPMVYGNPTNDSPAFYDVEVNFGASAFYYDPITVLENAGYDASELQLGWGAPP